MEITLKGEGIDDLRSKCMHFLDRTLSLDDWRKKRGHSPYKIPIEEKMRITEKNIKTFNKELNKEINEPLPSTFDTRPIPNVEEGAVSLSPRTLGDIAEELPYPAKSIIPVGDKWIITLPYLEVKQHFNEMVSACRRLGAKFNGDTKNWELVKQ